MTRKPLIVLSAAFFAFFALAGCEKAHNDEHAKAKEEKGHKDDGLIKLTDDEANRAGVKTETLGEQQLAETVELTATVEANPERIAKIAPRQPGRIVSANVKLGDHVKQGQVLAMIESTEVGEAYSAYVQALAEANVAKTTLDRAERLNADQIISGKEYQRAKGDYEKTRAHVQGASDKLRMMGVSPPRDQKGGPVSRFPVTAAISGEVIERKAVMGELAKPEQELFVVADLSRLWLQANVREEDLGKVKIGSRAIARFDAFAGEEFEGKVTHVGATLDKETRTSRATVELANKDGRLRPEMFGKVVIDTGVSRKVLAIPESAVTIVQGIPTVFVEEATGFHSQPIEIVGRSGGKVILKSGIKTGESVVTEGVYALKARLLKAQIGSGHAH